MQRSIFRDHKAVLAKKNQNRIIAQHDKFAIMMPQIIEPLGIEPFRDFKTLNVKNEFVTEEGIVLGWDTRQNYVSVVMQDDMVFLHTLVVGATGSGKSRFVLDLVYNISNSYINLCIIYIDLKGEVAPSLRFLPNGEPSKICDNIHVINDYHASTFENLIGPERILVFDYSSKNRADMVEEFYTNIMQLFSDIRDTVNQMQETYKAENVPFRMLFVVEEAWKFFPNTGSGIKSALMTESKKVQKVVKQIAGVGQEFANAGRSLGFGMIFVTTRIQELMTTIISESNTIVAKNMNSDNDIKKIKGTKLKSSVVDEYYDDIADRDRIKFAMIATSNANTIIELPEAQTYHHSVNPKLERRF